MAAETDQQAKPFAQPLVFQSHMNEEEAAEALSSTRSKLIFPRRCIKFCGCFTAFLLILAVTILILLFTIFHVKYPVVNITKITLLGLQFFNNGSYGNTLQADSTANLIVAVSIKNPNVASFKFNNSTTAVLYRGKVVGEAIATPGKAKARRTIHMNVSVDLVPEKLLSVPRFLIDFGDYEQQHCNWWQSKDNEDYQEIYYSGSELYNYL